MTSSSKRKQEKKKDFQVRTCPNKHVIVSTDVFAETKAEGWEGQAKGCEQYEHQLQSQV
jgi:hypothetical protein